MTPDQAVELVRRLLVEALVLSGPLLAAVCLLTFLLSLLQTLTSIQEQSLTAVPRLLMVALVLLAGMPWYVRRLVAYTTLLFADMHRYGGN
jgi:flagellar biosynthetic protein FliQ